MCSRRRVPAGLMRLRWLWLFDAITSCRSSNLRLRFDKARETVDCTLVMRLIPFKPSSIPAALLLVGMAVVFSLAPIPIHACLQSDAGTCTCCCDHEASAPMACCGDKDSAPADKNDADASSPVCCITLDLSTEPLTLQGRDIFCPVPFVSGSVAFATIDYSEPIFRVSGPEACGPPAGPRRHLSLCQFLL